MSEESRAPRAERASVPRNNAIKKLAELIQSMAVFSAGIALSIGLAAAQASSANRTPATQPEEIGTVQQVYDGTLYPDIQVRTFRNIDRLFPTRTVRRGSHVLSLPKSDVPLARVEFASAGKKYDLYDYLSLNRVCGLLVLKDGKIALERYELGNNDATRWMSMSVVKSITSTLVGVAIKDGYIKSIDDPVTKYLPKLAGSAYDGVRIKNLLQMASGVKWDETYTNPASDRRRMLELQIAGKAGSILEFMSTLGRAGEPGTVWNYNTGETFVVGELVHAAVKRPLAQYLSERIWSKIGMESDATWWLDSPDGREIGGSGLSATLRDYGRFGLFVMNHGEVGNEQILPENWFSEAGTSKIVGGKKVNYGYMWWIPDSSNPVHEGAFQAIGIFGQAIYINPAKHVVIVEWSARPKPTGATTINDEDFYAAVVKALH